MIAVALMVLPVVITTVTAAHAAWTQTASGLASGKSTSMPTGPTPTASINGGTVTLTWEAAKYVSTTTNVAGYTVQRLKGGVAEAVSGTCAGTVSTLTCNDSVSAAGSYTYKITPESGAWLGAESTASSAVNYTPPDTAAPSVTATCPTNSSGPWTTGNGGTWQTGCGSAISGTVTDDTGVAKIEVRVKPDNVATCWTGGNQMNASCATAFHEATLGTVGATSTTWTIPLARQALDPGRTYTVTIRATDSRSPANVSTTTSYTFST